MIHINFTTIKLFNSCRPCLPCWCLFDKDVRCYNLLFLSSLSWPPGLTLASSLPHHLVILITSSSSSPWHPCHLIILITSSSPSPRHPCHLVTYSPHHLVTLPPYHLLTHISSTPRYSSLRHPIALSSSSPSSLPLPLSLPSSSPSPSTSSHLCPHPCPILVSSPISMYPWVSPFLNTVFFPLRSPFSRLLSWSSCITCTLLLISVLILDP